MFLTRSVELFVVVVVVEISLVELKLASRLVLFKKNFPPFLCDNIADLEETDDERDMDMLPKFDSFKLASFDVLKWVSLVAGWLMEVSWLPMQTFLLVVILVPLLALAGGLT